PSVTIKERLASVQGPRVFPWLLSVVVLGAAPLGFAAYVLADEILQRRKATRLGTRFIPHVQGKWPGNLNKIVNVVLRLKNEYLGI
ncbi:uncharacterized protein BJ212DRAFT_1252914, partial [Suillus subaureus]